MNHRLSFIVPIAALCASTAVADAQLDAHVVTVGGAHEVTATLRGAEGEAFALLSPSIVRGGPPHLLGVGLLSASGEGTLTCPVSPQLIAADGELELYARYRDGARSVDVDPLFLPVLGGTPLCQRLDFDFALGNTDPVAGQAISNDWALVGLTVSADNAATGHPDLAVIFDSANPTGGDFDLATPGFGPGNDQELGKLLIIPENGIDGNADGLLDVPDDEAAGGTIAFDFDNPVSVCAITLVDVDDGPPTELRFFAGLDMTVIPVPNVGDNSVQTISFNQAGVDRMEVAFGGSGGIAEMRIEPCPILVNLDENSFGVPLGVQAGTVISTQFAAAGLTVSAVNPSGPDIVVLFDSENPTGGDFDLMTPGRGANNDTPLGLVMVIAENDIDMDGDGLIDDPDDQNGGGQMTFDFASDVSFFTATVLDVDGTEEDVFEFFDSSDNLITTIQIGALGDNSVQTLGLTEPITGVRRIVLTFGGSGAVTRLRWCPGTVITPSL